MGSLADCVCAFRLVKHGRATRMSEGFSLARHITKRMDSFLHNGTARDGTVGRMLRNPAPTREAPQGLVLDLGLLRKMGRQSGALNRKLGFRRFFLCGRISSDTREGVSQSI
ncbi:hypothetical protein, unlikely [Trypanosoma brucei gambiense DAL972]|uniref:Uncharacterized protein n=1 Tax=Trypanosoma brucei gambiense (strain MHOM/CI/86/DAL972) TaxID=679716 RepID=D0A3T1_TRYB9|nr:hypothetical protein, unlikely [Trypanosoma brucei gambiense DAL972]CBH15925.1 hypothetical protein, unlikely [Trypanosoma brucei gambiense DAL972]|eukprot:XP_011778189.1 hypothetical protein, unlikely [Trypanosoma brucei gambiense DAL972]